MLVYKDRAYCSHMHQCGNFQCYRNMPEEEYFKVLDAQFALALADFKSEDCGYIEMLNRHREE